MSTLHHQGVLASSWNVPPFAKKYWRIQLIFKKQNYSKEIEIFFEKLDSEQ